MESQSPPGPSGGRLVVCGVPIGNIGDASERLRVALTEADVVAAEDTRRLRRLARELGVTVSGRIVSYYDAVEDARTPDLVKAMLDGQVVALVSDAGMPGVSDPSFRLVSACHAQGIPVSVLPGPSAALAALTISGLPPDRFVFEGFLPRKAGQRATRLAALAQEPRTVILFESPRRTARLLDELVEAFGRDRPAALCRELTKTHEEVITGTLDDVVAATAGREVLGEVTLVIGGAPTRTVPPAPTELAERVRRLERDGLARKDAMRQVARDAGVPRREVFDALLDASPGDSAGA